MEIGRLSYLELDRVDLPAIYAWARSVGALSTYDIVDGSVIFFFPLRKPARP